MCVCAGSRGGTKCCFCVAFGCHCSHCCCFDLYLCCVCRFQALYRFRLLQRCFRRWAGQHRCLGIARQWHRWRVLSSALGALEQAAEKRHAQTHTLQHRHRALTLTRAFQHVSSTQLLCVCVCVSRVVCVHLCRDGERADTHI